MLPSRLPRPVRPLRWIASSRKDYNEFPVEVQRAFGFGLFLTQTGQHPPNAKPLKGLGSGVELIDDHEGDTYRTVYTVHLESAIYALHAFKKKSKRGIKTPKRDLDLIRRRLRDAMADHQSRTKKDDPS